MGVNLQPRSKNKGRNVVPKPNQALPDTDNTQAKEWVAGYVVRGTLGRSG